MPDALGRWVTIEEAQMALNEARLDMELDQPGLADSAHNDLVCSVAENCSLSVRAELYRREGVERW